MGADDSRGTLPRYHLAVDAHGQPKRSYEIEDAAQLRTALFNVHARALDALKTGHAVEVQLQQFDPIQAWQRGRLNALCADIAAQVKWHGKRRTKDDWRHMLIAAYRGDACETVPNPNGQGFVVLGASSKELSRREANDVIVVAEEFGARNDVKFSAPRKMRTVEPEVALNVATSGRRRRRSRPAPGSESARRSPAPPS